MPEEHADVGNVRAGAQQLGCARVPQRVRVAQLGREPGPRSEAGDQVGENGLAASAAGADVGAVAATAAARDEQRRVAGLRADAAVRSR